MRIGNLEVPGMLALAPMAGVTDLAFRTVCAGLGADMTVTEMVSSRALVYQDQKSRGLLKKNEGSICGAQIFGNDPAIMAEAAVLAAEISGCDFIDINMGCPMPKIANNGDGCGLMKEAKKAIYSGEGLGQNRLYLHGALWASGGALLTGLVWLLTAML